MKHLSAFLLLLLSGVYCHAQDTIKLEPSIHYSRKDYPVYNKEFVSMAKYAREDIIFSATRKTVEYCFYYGDERNCFGSDYELVGDTLIMNGEHWRYRRKGNNYRIERYYEGTYETGLADSLIPLHRKGIFVTTTADKRDTLWSSDYSQVRRHPLSGPKTTYYTTRVKGKIFNATEVDEAPSFLNGDSLPTIELPRTRFYYGEPMRYVKGLKFVVTAEGRIVNIVQNPGNFDLAYQSDYIMDLIRYVLKWGTVKPATRKGKPVNAEWRVKVEM